MIRHIAIFTLKDTADLAKITKAVGTYRTWDTHPEHERIRKEFIFPQVTAIARCQFRVDER